MKDKLITEEVDYLVEKKLGIQDDDYSEKAREKLESIKEKAKALLPDLNKIKEQAKDQGVPEDEHPLPDLKRHAKIYDTPLQPNTVSVLSKKTKQSYQKDMNFDSTNLNYLFGFYAYRAIRSFITQALNEKSGFPQTDKTYAVYPHFYNMMKKFKEKDFDDLNRKSQEPFMKIGDRALSSFMAHLLEK
ncbi:hypothetical protein LCGC14_0342040 [marine sediment metagenome]|uniref:Uncharacterized protein n=1 Tax=marine sediment metagenome TaxID=412755 RepID=A0A0F9TW59_9ZZZZ